MAKKMSYTDPLSGFVYPDSTWVPMGVFADFAALQGRVEFLCYPTQELAAQKLKHCLGLPGGVDRGCIASKAYSLTPDQVRAYALALAAGPTVLDDMSNIGYKAAAETLDKPAPSEEDPDRKVSFFDGAVDVALV